MNGPSSRKIKEALLALDIEKRYSKDQILTMYANQIFLGHGAYGVEAAAELYFQKVGDRSQSRRGGDAGGDDPERQQQVRSDQTTRERSQPAQQGPVANARTRIHRWAGYEEAIAQPLGVALHRERVKNGAYFLEMTRKEIERRYGTDALYTSGLQVHLTMDPQLQFEAEKALREGLVDLEMTYLGYRRPPNVLTEGGLESVEDYDDPSWQQLELVPGAMVKAVVRRCVDTQGRSADR